MGHFVIWAYVRLTLVKLDQHLTNPYLDGTEPFNLEVRLKILVNVILEK